MIELTPEVILIAKAKRYATEKHKGQKYGDEPYTYHLELVVANVAMRKKGDPMLSTYIAAAWLHDVMEDCGVLYSEIEREFGVAIAYAVQCLTKTKDESYQRYIQSCIDCAVAREVKICDTMANLTESFKSSSHPNPTVRAKGAKGIAKYPLQLHMLIEGCVD